MPNKESFPSIQQFKSKYKLSEAVLIIFKADVLGINELDNYETMAYIVSNELDGVLDVKGLLNGLVSQHWRVQPGYFARLH